MLPPGSLPCGPRSAVGKASPSRLLSRLHMSDTPTLGRVSKAPGRRRKRQQHPAASLFPLNKWGRRALSPKLPPLPWQTVLRAAVLSVWLLGALQGWGRDTAGPGGGGDAAKAGPPRVFRATQTQGSWFCTIWFDFLPNLQEPKSCYLCRVKQLRLGGGHGR